jgi:medium-chain acyl-[acyl-carrier-protein] hydrolase
MLKNSGNKWFVFPKVNTGAKLRLFCFPYSGSGASTFRMWPSHLPTGVEVCAVQLPGREERLRERPFTRVEQLVKVITEEILPYLDKPFALFGHSLGALVAFEVARQLYRCSIAAPEHLFVSARAAPQSILRETPMHSLPPQQFIARLRDFNGTPEAILHNQELMELFLPIIRADFELNETYCYEPESSFSCPITAYYGMQDHVTHYADVVGWAEHTTGKFTVRTLPGDHFFIQKSANLFWSAINADLNQIVSQI